jgi:hypothetical protein
MQKKDVLPTVNDEKNDTKKALLETGFFMENLSL